MTSHRTPPRNAARSQRGPTIVDVARRAGVSAMTVSRVINSPHGVSVDTRSRVNEAISALNYTPNVAARSLVTSREIKLGVIYSNPSAGFMSEFLTGVFEEASNAGAQLILLKGDQGRPPTASALTQLIASGVRAVILAPPLGESRVVLDALRAADLPMAVVGGVADDAISVRINDHKAAYDITRHLIDMGHRRIAFVIGNPDQSASAERLTGFHAAVREAGNMETTVTQGDFSYASGLEAGERLLAQTSPPTAVFASNDDMAAAIVSVAHRRHLSVPEDLSVVGFDDSTTAVTLWPPLTTVCQPVHQLAAEALQRLIRVVQGESSTDLVSKNRLHILPHRVIERLSVSKPKYD